MSDASAPVSVGEMLAGKYRIDRVLGAGGMGVVVAATHVQLDQRVAIKFLLPQALASADVVARFQREARAAVKIQSEHVARVIDVGVLESGAPYMVMEYLEGNDLAHRIAAEGALSVGEAVRYVLEACEALAEAHAAGIVHRDLKPANLFLARRADKTSMVKVLDFGISKVSSSGGASQGGMTSTQAVMGSPYYMSPEQLMSAKHVDARADVWSLGIVLYESLVGSPPYLGDTMPEIVAQILQAPVPSVSARRSDVPAQVDRIVATCLAKDPSARYRDVGALARDLAALAPDGARSVDRISRVLGSSPDPAPAPATDRASSDGRGGTVALSGAGAPMDALQRSGSGAGATSQPSAWGATHMGLPRRSNGLLIGAIAAGALAILGVVLFVALHHGNDPAAPAQAGLVETPPAPTSAATLAPTTEPATATSTATATATATVAEPHPHATKPGAPAVFGP